MYDEMGYKAAILPGMLPAAEAIGIAGVLKSLIEHDPDAPFFESFPDGAELRAWCGGIGGVWATDILKRYHPGSANRGSGGH